MEQTVSHPLDATLLRVAALDENMYANVGTLETGWFPAAALMEAQSPFLEEALERQAAHYPQMDSRTKGAYFIGRYSWYIAAAAIATYLAEGRVPDLSPHKLALCYEQKGDKSGDAGRIHLRFLSRRFATLPHDPDAHHADALVLPNKDALRDWFRSTLEAHVTPLIARVHQQTRLGHYAQWCLVADSCAALFLNIGRMLKDEAQGKAEGLAFIKSPSSPMNNSKTGYVSLQYLDYRETFCVRGGCCRYYTVSDTAEKCSTCVLRKPEERNQRLLDYMAKQYAQESGY
jgi:hypothetical protein